MRPRIKTVKVQTVTSTNSFRRYKAFNKAVDEVRVKKTFFGMRPVGLSKELAI